MARATRSLSVAIVAGVFASLCLIGLATQAQGASKPKSGSMSVTGCLQKGAESGGYYITDNDNKMWELSSHSVKLGEHVGHKVTVTGTAVQKSKAAEKKAGENEKSEASGKPYGDLSVKSLKMVSESCQ